MKREVNVFKRENVKKREYYLRRDFIRRYKKRESEREKIR